MYREIMDLVKVNYRIKMDIIKNVLWLFDVVVCFLSAIYVFLGNGACVMIETKIRK